ncbi:hypothetical protein XELAEV_18019608mg [Xenopus laevis]|uniref:G-protein coupled receptors family 1 profile domain-containing protein n=1 Tax=Xenopus laevis TaxID=8355 RepID=A0A974DFG8_XENLA|nr:hypothetical protein XELAEV_18019608mg [Xenopus laevis]
MKNQTLVNEIVLLGFQNLHNLKIPLFSLFLLIYIMTVWENVLIIVLVSSSRKPPVPHVLLSPTTVCISHLAVVSIFYGALTAIYVVPPRKESQAISKVLSLLYTVVTPLVNPLIYSLRSKDIRAHAPTMRECECADDAHTRKRRKTSATVSGTRGRHRKRYVPGAPSPLRPRQSAIVPKIFTSRL